MMLVEETTVPQAALPVATFKDHMRLGSGFSDDGLQDSVLENMLRAAIAAIEAQTGKILIERDFSWTLTRWRDAAGQALPVAPVSGIVGVTLIDCTGAETAIAPMQWQLLPDAQRPRLAPAGTSLPTISRGGSVRIDFMAGFGPEWTDVPITLAQAVLMLATHYYEYRHDVSGTQTTLPFGVASLIAPFRTIRLSSGGWT